MEIKLEGIPKESQRWMVFLVGKIWKTKIWRMMIWYFRKPLMAMVIFCWDIPLGLKFRPWPFEG